MKHIIKKIEDSSLLRGDVCVGDELLTINGTEIRDVLDYKFHAYDARLTITLRTPDGTEKTVKVRKGEGEDLGIEFETYLMDRARHCANNCVFCFVDQMPKGMRKTLYFKDDDARLSFLMGNYITLTNLSAREIQRIIDLRISPINISVHTTNPELRVQMLKNPKAGECLDAMRRFAEAGITMNCQIVCCPGLNDGEELLRSMRDLAAMYPAVHSVSIVPVGLTKYREGLFELTPFNPESAAETIDLVTKFGDECIDKFGSRIFFCSDELYIEAGRELPEDEFFEDYAQLENGVGMLRLQEFEFESALKFSDEPGSVSFSVACGESAAPFMEKLIFKAKEKYDNIDGKVYAIKNDFFGHSINVSGLITGQDLIAQLKGKDLGEHLFITQNMLRRYEMDFLYDVTLEDASAALGVPIYPVEQDGGCLCDAFLGILPEVKLPKRESGNEEYYKYN
ncbi:MAG: DUF512 domain-containing protein [Oscillospiraceae bacterium]|nr:DUF512 domain-containing protein [Oscillospiraceae bacterium]